MSRPTQRITVVTRPTRLEGLLARWATKGQVLYQMRAAKVVQAARAGRLETAARLQQQPDDADFDVLENEDSSYRAAVKSLLKELDLGYPVQAIPRNLITTYDFSFSAAVVVLGQDGLVANTAKYVGDVAVLGVNPDPRRFDGVLLPFQVHEARAALKNHFAGHAQTRPVTLAEVTLQDGQQMLAFNDFFVGVRSHVSARYKISVGGQSESHSSSGVLVSTGAGSTGWMSSVYNMASAIAARNPPLARPRLRWEDRHLLWAVREPFVSRTSQATLVCGQLEADARLELESMTAENGVIFSDGIETDSLDFNAGTIATVGVARQTANLIVK